MTVTGFYDEHKLLKTFKLQRALTLALEDSKTHSLLASLPLEQKAYVLSQRHIGAAAKFMALPTNPHTTISPPTFRNAVRQVLGILLLKPANCTCKGHPLLSVCHCLSCRTLRGRFNRHDLFVALLCRYMRDAGMVVTKELLFLVASSKRMDIVESHTSTRSFYDVSDTNPVMPTYEARASKEE
jgi:hypothetical protein